ncbi:hypothetical protein CPB83DRAFT_430068 [Crepidotus variabilis]|uniref:Protein kinase domain-containing protein n=1 Tax=Crepidotus variabilis TaxID=179855 RepID=A0A9P6ECU1_9AGAR|nr:hypothetical protein CPB83DRAFT_430068 [Crepidotus variabilis]
MPITLESLNRQFPQSNGIVRCNNRNVWIQQALMKSEGYSAFQGYCSGGGAGGLCVLHVYRSASRDIWAHNSEWFRQTYPPNDSVYSFLDASSVPGFCYIVLRQPSATLRSVLSNSDLRPLPRRQACEIVYQVVKGIEALLSGAALLGDITPEDIEMEDLTLVNEEFWDPMARRMSTRQVLKSTQLRVLYKGTCRLEGWCDPATLAYRAPEVAFGVDWAATSVMFAMGCVAFEVMTQRPLLLAPTDTAFPLAQMVYQYHHILGALPNALKPHFRNISGVRSVDEQNEAPVFEEGVITAASEAFVRRSSIRMDILDDLAYDLIVDLAQLNFSSRPNVLQAQSSLFFEGLFSYSTMRG